MSWPKRPLDPWFLVRCAVLMDVFALGRETHIDVRIAATGAHAAPQHDECAVRIAIVAKVMPIPRPFREGREITGAEHNASRIFDQHSFAGGHDHELVLTIVPVPLRGPGPRLQDDLADSKIGQAGSRRNAADEA